MSIEIKVPVLPESVEDATIAAWHKKPGEFASKDEKLVDIETDKVVLEVVAPKSGALKTILSKEGDRVRAEEVIGVFEVAEVSQSQVPQSEAVPVKSPQKSLDKERENEAVSKPEATIVASTPSPSVRRMLVEHHIAQEEIMGTGKNGQVTKKDVEMYLAKVAVAEKSSSQPLSFESGPGLGAREEKRVPMSRLRAKIAERLLSAQHNAAILTTFNEINMQPLMDLRAKHKEKFQQQYDAKLGLMSFFTKATIEALKRYAVLNASVDGEDVVYHGYFDIGIAVSTDRGLVVPILRDADKMSIVDLERNILALSQKARLGKLTLEDMTGGTFTITNGGVFGSLLATPIINPPQTGILGMHKIEERPIAEKGEVVIRPMMYVALSYDHRLVDGQESVQFLRTIKEGLEEPTRLLLEV